MLKDLSDRVLQILRSSPVAGKLSGLESDLDEARPELAVHVDRERAALYGLSTADVAGVVRTAVQGTEASRYRTGNDEYDIVVRLAEPWRKDLESLRDLVVQNGPGEPIPLVSVARWTVGEGLGSIRRKDMDRMATISSDVRAGLNKNAVLAEVQQGLAPFVENELPPGYTVRYTGQQEDQAEAMSFLTTAFLAALGLIAFILVTQFNSVIKPLIILTSVIMSTAGVLFGLMVFRMPFGIIMTGVGVISLAGIVVNNAIVLVHYIDVLRRRDGLERQAALVRAGRTRLRPVILTAVTTALGLVPLAIGLNFDFFGLYGSLDPDLYWGGEQAAWWGPMAIAVIVGILFATFLTLVPRAGDVLPDRRHGAVLRPPLLRGGGAGGDPGEERPGSGRLRGPKQLRERSWPRELSGPWQLPGTAAEGPSVLHAQSVSGLFQLILRHLQSPFGGD